MVTNISFEAHDEPISEILFANRKFEIPRYQRPYAWTIDHVTEFWEDLSGSDEPYFLGSFIFNTEHESIDGYVDIIDGQQRLLTITILVAVLRDYASKFNKEWSDLVQRQDIAIEDRSGDLLFRIEPSETLRAYFRKYIQDSKNDITQSMPSTLEERRVKENYEYLLTQLASDLGNIKNPEAKLTYLKNLRDKVSRLIAIQVEITNEEDAYEIFETTNARGLDLSVADLLKNLIFKQIPAGEERDFAKEEWLDINQNIESTKTDLRRFIRYFWRSKYSFVPEKRLFRVIKTTIKDWQQLLDNLWTDSDMYNKLLQGDENDFSGIEYGAKLFPSIQAIRVMGVSQCYVLLLAILRNIKELKTNPTRVIKFIELFTFQYSVIGKQPTNRIERIYSRYAIELERIVTTEPEKRISGMVQSLFSSLIRELKELLPPKQVFCESFLELAYRNSEERRKLIVYILSQFESSLQQYNEFAINFAAVNIEHILPQSPSKEWNLTKTEIKSYVNLLGNLTLLSIKLNSIAQNGVIQKKLPDLAKSEIKITQAIVKSIQENENKWGREEIIKRHKEMAEIAYASIWSVDGF